MNNAKKYFKTTTPKKEIKVQLFYDKGGMNYLSGGSNPRGYYVSATPVERDGQFESMVMFSGIKECVLQVTRQSPKSEALAVSKIPEVEKKLIDHVCKKQNLVLADQV